MSKSSGCAFCGALKATHECGICGNAVCKECLQYVDTHSFSFFSKVPKELTLGNFCPPCFESKIAPQKEHYEELMEKAKDIYFLTKAYPGYIRVLQRHTKRVQVEACDDRRETIMRLAFFAAELGFNSIIEAEVESSKRRVGGYQSSTWTGSAMPAKIDGDQLERSSLRRL